MCIFTAPHQSTLFMAKGVRPGTVKRELKPITSDSLSEETLAICKAFRSLRLQRNLTQQLFADELGVKLEYIKAVEQGRFAPSHQLIVRFSDLYQVSIDWIYRSQLTKASKKGKSPR